MKGKNYFTLVFFVLAVFAALQLFEPRVADGQEEWAGPPGVAITGNDEDLESKNPGKTPYVAPQPQMSTPSETSGLETIIHEDSGTVAIDDDAGGDFGLQAGFAFGKDRVVSNFNGSYGARTNPAVAVTSDGVLYAAMEALNTDSGYYRIVIRRSTDYGRTWTGVTTVQNPGANLRTPSVAIGGVPGAGTNGHRLLVAWITEAATPRVGLYSRNLADGTGVVVSPPGFAHPYAKPIIFTDSPYWTGLWYAFIVAEGHIDAAANNINIEYWRSTDGGLTWPDNTTNRKTIYGDTDTHEWREPDILWKSTPPHITAYRKNTRTIYYTKNLGTNTQAILTIPGTPSYEAYPRIAGIPAVDTLMMVYNGRASGGTSDYAYYTYSRDNGTTWFGPWVFPNQTTSNSTRPVVTATAYEPGYFHAFFTDNIDNYHYRRALDTLSAWSSRKQVTDTRVSISNRQKGIAAFHDNAHAFMVWTDYNISASPQYQIHGDRTYPDDLLGTWNGQGVYFRTERANWFNMATPATLITTGDLDGDGTDDLIGIWPGQGGVWVKYSSTGAWVLLSTTADWIATGDMNGNGRDDLIGTWSDQGVYYRNSVTGAWVHLATPATKITAGDLDNDGTDDLIGIWPGQGGVWVKYSSTGAWALLSTTAHDISAGDMTGNGRDDLLGTWEGQGVYYRNSVSGAWVHLATPATLITAGDLDSDGKDDLIGIWPGQGGVWAKYSQTDDWHLLSSTAVAIAAGMMRGGGGSWATGAFRELPQPFGGAHIHEPFRGMPGAEDASAFGPGGEHFRPGLETGLVPAGSAAPIPGPGMAGFTFETTANPNPGERMEEREKPVKK